MRVCNRRWLPVILGLMISMGAIAPGAAQQRDPDQKGGGHTLATPGATPVSSACALVEPYTNALYTAIDESDAFAEFFYSDDEFGDLTVAEAEEIVADGNAMIEKLENLDVPAPYADAHEGILTFLKVNIDMARFYGIDTSVVPDLSAYDSATSAIYQGEIEIAEACPDEVDAVGGYVLFDPRGFDDGPVEDLPE